MKTEFKLLERQVINLAIRWQLQTNLFHEHRHRRDIFEWGGHAWHSLDRALMESVASTIGRLMDPAVSFRKENASFAYFMQRRTPDPTRADTISPKLAALQATYQTQLKPWRDQVFSHTDKETASNPSALPALPRSVMEGMVLGIFDLAEDLYLEMHDGERSCEFGSVSLLFKDGPGAILQMMEKGIHAQAREIEENRKRWEKGEVPLPSKPAPVRDNQ